MADTFAPISPEVDAMLKKCARMIATTPDHQAPMLRRWVSLMNQRVRQDGVTFSLAGASAALQRAWEARFGRWYPAIEPVSRVDR